MPYEVAPGRCLLHSGTKYPSGSLVPPKHVSRELCDSGVVRLVEEKVSERPDPEPQGRSTAVADFDASDASSVTNVPLRLLPNVLKDIDDADLLLEMHEADSRKGGKDLIEERIGELEVEDD